MTQFSLPWPDTDNGYDPIVGDGRKITAEEFARLLLATFGSGVIPTGNRLAVTSPGANQISVNTGYAIVAGRFYPNDAVVSLTPASAGVGTTRQDSVILECDWTGGGETEQYTVRVVTKAGTAGAPPSMTQIESVLWQERLYDYTIDDAGIISGLTDQRVYSTFNTQVATAMLQDAAVTAAKLAAGVGPVIGDLKENAAASLGGSDGRRMVVGGVVYESWVHCDGGAPVNGVTIPDLRGRVIAGASGSHAAGTIGGQDTLNFSHFHTVNIVSGTESAKWNYQPGTTPLMPAPGHTHNVVGNTGSTLANTDMRQATTYACRFIYVG